MAQGSKLAMQALQSAELAPIVAQAINKPTIDFLDWQVHEVANVGGSKRGAGLGVFRLIGSAQATGQVFPWSVIVKVLSGSDTAVEPHDTYQLPAAWDYWKREILVYRSGIVAELSGNLVGPRCYGITEHADDEWCIWLEDVSESLKVWTTARHGIAARHLGQFNGAYLSGRALPEKQPWMYGGRARDWIGNAAPMFEQFELYASSASGKRWLSEQSVERMQRLVRNYHPLLARLETLPVCLCHHDAFRRNLLARDSLTASQTVAIDWSMFGYGHIGEDAGITTGVALSLLEVAGDQAREMDRLTFASYVDGLRDVGWQGDVRLARFGYATTVALVVGVSWAIFMGVLVFSTDEGIRFIESAIGAKVDDILAQWAVMQPFFLDFGDEAFRLLDEIG